MRTIIDIRPMLERHRGGVANYTASLVAALCARSADSADRRYTLFCNAYGRPLPPDLPAASPSVGHAFTKLPNRLLNIALAAARRPLIEDLAGDADAVYLPNLNFVATNKPLIVTVHDLSFLRYPEFFSAKQRLWHRLVRPVSLLRRATAIAAVSEHTKTDLIELLGLPAGRIAVVSPAAGPEFRPAGAAGIARIRRKFSLEREFFLCLATLEPRKNIGAVIAAFEKSGDGCELVIAGGRGWLCRDLFHQAELSPARERIRFLDHVADGDRPALYSAALALVYPSFYEGFGMPPLEAMACGAPVIASSASSLGEVIGTAGLLVDPYNIAELAEAMTAVRGEPELRQRLALAGPVQARKYSWEESAGRLEQLIEAASGK